MNPLFLFKKSTYTYLLLLSLLLAAASCAVTKKHDQVKPTVYLIGDSTVKNGKGNGDGGLWGWGNFLHTHFDTTKVSIENHALGGTSSRTFRTYGHWEKVLAQVQAGDYVLMQFGHNDSSPVNDTLRARGTLQNNSDDTEEIENLITKKHEVVHSYGWYLRAFIKDAKAKGAIPVVLSPVPRNQWAEGKANRNADSYGKWAAEAAAQEGVVFIDLNAIIADRYEKEGEAKVRSTYFNTTDHTHTIEEGAKVNAAAVAHGISEKKELRLRKHLLK
ncbi:rhamnogalacturonan acetylesterase [Pontibacter qinzhouensis]|uniref:Rhamnogalacturonan acetylesterase n=1 Tax=Pontibacter qinzhouensis TaxID=2603253 RepID=A0A5C8K837_9BACT|nr:rhamnogalacturonan acetylesterase [Pontibacter qinzhouensis]TXK46051.1 rhamnogalacturonan acetylesterase [Pontibacter qinzhouensis]